MARSLLGVVLVCAIFLFAMAEGIPKPKPKPKPKPIEPKEVKCLLPKQYPKCTMKQYCPSKCPKACVVNCNLCKPICLCDLFGAVCQDPRFVGGDGITFYFHGKKDRDFCLLSDSDLHINAHFIGRRDPTMSRDFTWVQSITVLFNDHRLFVGAQKTATWDDSVDRLMIAFDGEPVYLSSEEGSKWQSSAAPIVYVVRSSDANAVTVEVDGKFKFTANVVPITEEESRVHRYGVTADDCLAHLELGFKFYSLTDNVHGVLGQTYRNDYVSRVKISSNMPIMSGEHKFSSSDLYATDCAVARFGRGGPGITTMVAEQGGVECQSNMNGRGIVCKK